MLLSQIVEALGSRVAVVSGNMDTEISGACSDSRKVGPGTLFCAMKGAKLDGHGFIDDALRKGAAAVLHEHPVTLPPDFPAVQICGDAYPALGVVAELLAKRPCTAFRSIGVTGTNGKTTTAYLLRDIFRKAGYCTSMLGTVEYDLGKGKPLPADRTTPTPFQLQELLSEIRDNGADWNIMEISSHSLAQERMGSMMFDAAVFTNLTQDHLDYHREMESYYQAKKTLFAEHLTEGGTAVINFDDPRGQRLAHEIGNANIFTFTFTDNPAANVYCKNLKTGTEGTEYDIIFDDQEIWHIKTPLTGSYNGANTAGAAIAAKALGLNETDIAEALAKCKGAPGRLEKVPVPDEKFSVFVDYAHTDDALRNVLTALQKLPHNKIRLVFGCGGDRDKKKRPLMGKAAADSADFLYVTSDNPRTENPEEIIANILDGIPEGTQFMVEPDRFKAIMAAITSAQEGDIVLIAGKGHEDYQEVNGVKHHFNDAEIAAEIINPIQ